MGDTSSSKALVLKNEGNALLAKRKFKNAYEKYTLAIQVDEKSAVLYANRSACLLGMKRDSDALGDAMMATLLDPGYSKGWARYAAASESLRSYDEAVFAWQLALKALPSNKLTPAESKLKDQYTAGLSVAKREMELAAKEQKAQHNTESLFRLQYRKVEEFVLKPNQITSWDRAAELIPKLKVTGNVHSSAWIIHFAYLDYSKGLRMMSSIRQESGKFIGELGAVEAILKGILRDKRVFHLRSMDDFIKFDHQIRFEDQERRGWADSMLSPKQILDEAQARLKEERWDTVRPAFNITIQSLVLRAFLMCTALHDCISALHIYNMVVKTLNMADEPEYWKAVKPMDKGQVFRQWFMRGVKALRLDAYEKICFGKSESGDDPEYNFKGLRELCIELCDEKALEGHSPKDSVSDPGSQYSFFIYPMMQAITLLAKCLSKEGIFKCRNLMELQLNSYKHMQISLKAVSLLPPDDEYHFLHMYATLSNMSILHCPPSTTKPLMSLLQSHRQKMRYLWVHTKDKQEQHAAINMIMDAESEGPIGAPELMRVMREGGVDVSWAGSWRGKVGEGAMEDRDGEKRVGLKET